MTPLHHAAKENNDAVLRTLLAKARDMYQDGQRRQMLIQYVNAISEVSLSRGHLVVVPISRVCDRMTILSCNVKFLG